MVNLWKSDTAKWGTQFSNFGFLVDPGDDLPVGLKRGTVNPKLVHETCATCHVTKLEDGRIWSGMPAEGLAFPAFSLAVNQAWIAAGNSSLISDAAIKKMQGVLHPGSTNADSVDDPHVVPADFPLYVDLGQRDHLNYIGAAANPKSEIFLSIFTFGAGAGDIPFPPSADTIALVAYLSSIAPPKPMTIDQAAAAQRSECLHAVALRRLPPRCRPHEQRRDEVDRLGDRSATRSRWRHLRRNDRYGWELLRAKQQALASTVAGLDLDSTRSSSSS